MALANGPSTLTPTEALDVLRSRLSTPPPKVTIEGGGIPDPQSLSFDYVVLMHRWEIDELIRIIEAVAVDTPTVRGT